MFNTLLKFTFLQYNLVLYFSWSISIIYLKSRKWLWMVCSSGLNLRYDLLQELFSYISIFINSKTLCIPCQTLNIGNIPKINKHAIVVILQMRKTITTLSPVTSPSAI